MQEIDGLGYDSPFEDEHFIVTETARLHLIKCNRLSKALVTRAVM